MDYLETLYTALTVCSSMGSRYIISDIMFLIGYIDSVAVMSQWEYQFIIGSKILFLLLLFSNSCV